MENEIDTSLQRVRTELAPLEPQRVQVIAANRSDRLVGFAVLGAGVALALAMLPSSSGNPLPAIIAGAIGVIIGAVFFYRAHKRGATFLGRLKYEMMRRLLDAIQPGLQYDPASGIPKSMFTASRLFSHNPDRYDVEDLIHGRVGETDIMLSEVHAQYRSTTTDSKGRTRTTYHTFFRGLFMCADFHKHFRGTMRVMPNSTSFLGGLGRALSAFRPFSSEQLVRLEDPEFEKTFNVFGSDDIEARYILSPGMMRRMLDLRERWNDDIRLSFLDSNVCIAIEHGGDFFEPALNRPADSQQQLQRIVGEIGACLGIVEDLNLNTRIWSKE
jgi:hypothetical protein